MLIFKIMADKLIRADEIDKLSQEDIYQMYEKHVNPGMLNFFKLLGFLKIRPIKSEGMYIYTSEGKKILDFTGGRGVLSLGHNHPRLNAVRKKMEQDEIPVVWKDFVSPYLAVLSKNLAAICPGDLNYSFFCNSGAEANEGAMKIAEKYQGKEKNVFIAASNSYHGKTHATLSVSGCEESKKYFKLLDNCFFVPYGDYNALVEFISKRKDICAVILESIHAGNITVPPAGYLKKVRQLTEQNNILLILDEVYTGFGKTGKLFAFEHEGIVPDIITLSKTLGGGKATIAAYVVKDHIFKKAYGAVKDSLIHTTTYNGFANECLTAIEAINILFEENLVENSKAMGEYLLSQLESLKNKYPEIIKEVRGIGLLCGIEFYPYLPKVAGFFKKNKIFLGDMFNNYVTGAIISELLSTHDILVFSSPHYGNLLHIQPALIVKKEEIDRVVRALDLILSKGLFKLGLELSKRYLW